MKPSNRDNQGEGNPEADRRYREKTGRFVHSKRGQEQIRRAGEVNAADQQEIEAAEAQGKARAKEHDPQETFDPRRKS
jgi:hypothetical protein